MRAFLVFILLSLLSATPSGACSVEDGYKVPTNFELVRKATVIVLARVKDVPASMQPGHALEPQVTLEPVRFLKGSAPADQLGLIGWRQPGKTFGIPTTTTLSQSHFSTGIGGCVRQFYSPGELVVAMFGPNSNPDETSRRKLFQLFEP